MFSYKLDDETELRLLEDRHAQPLFRLTEENREYLSLWLPWVQDIRTLADTQRFIRQTLKQFADNDGFHAGIWHQGDLAGVIGFHHLDWLNYKTEIGYWLGQRFQGKGIMTRACQALVDHAFFELGLNRVEIRCGVSNKRSRAIPERLGFEREGVVRHAEWLFDHYVDLVIYSMLAEDWTKAS
jgi:ribosomal-protein-serine acetyltransferase